ncbi:MAG: cell division ATP-binding protein FtsE [Deltaproteobacteria bacterium]|nr:cell division ATP-binding protein FtsE [Deltaproteobacteria bacterium]MBW2011123.1 cell division ATP-binding protein FtsE [Deltaproteobacteria bacterium]MBW2100569.1 cell division ATP-binding protein FtsE [Deltaproteobacteria bacterium]
MIDKNAIIRVFHVHKRYGSKNALIDVTFDVAKNEFLFISGPNGAGKSSLLKLLYLAEGVSEGEILIDGINLSRISRKRIPLLRRKIGVIFQDFKLIPTKTVFENVALVLEVAGNKKHTIQKKVKRLLRAGGMEEKLDSYPAGLSSGEQQRVAFARAVAGDPKIILADEPTGSLDDESAGIILDILKKLHVLGTTVIIATHNKELIHTISARTIYLEKGRLKQDIPRTSKIISL